MCVQGCAKVECAFAARRGNKTVTWPFLKIFDFLLLGRITCTCIRCGILLQVGWLGD